MGRDGAREQRRGVLRKGVKQYLPSENMANFYVSLAFKG